VSALHSLFGLLPIPLLFGLLAETTSLTPAMLWVELGALLLLLTMTFRLPARPGQQEQPMKAGDQRQ
jgi:hypothetical protein